MSRLNPISTAASIIASTNSITKAGPLPETAVAMSRYFSSGKYAEPPSAVNMLDTVANSDSVMFGVAVQTV